MSKEITLKQAIRTIVKDWEVLNKKNPEWNKPNSVAVWVTNSDMGGSYWVDEEWIGISPHGNIVWAFASGCSCWEGDYDENTKPTIKELTLNHKHTPEDWEKAIIRFAETKKLQTL